MEQVRDGQGRVIGFLNDVGSVVVLLSGRGQVLGRYHKEQDFTYDANGVRMGEGNQLMRLVRWALTCRQAADQAAKRAECSTTGLPLSRGFGADIPAEVESKQLHVFRRHRHRTVGDEGRECLRIQSPHVAVF